MFIDIFKKINKLFTVVFTIFFQITRENPKRSINWSLNQFQSIIIMKSSRVKLELWSIWLVDNKPIISLFSVKVLLIIIVSIKYCVFRFVPKFRGKYNCVLHVKKWWEKRWKCGWMSVKMKKEKSSPQNCCTLRRLTSKYNCQCHSSFSWINYN